MNKDKYVWVKVWPSVTSIPVLLNDLPVEGDSPCSECPDAGICQEYLSDFGCTLCGEAGHCSNVH